MTSSGHIYKIICTLDEKFCYIGSTFNRLSKRFELHRKNYKRWKEEGDCGFSCFPYFDKYGVENFKIILIKSYEVCRSHVKDRRHLLAYETLWINKTKCVNKQVAFNPLYKNKRYRSLHHKINYLNNPNVKASCYAYDEKNKDKRRAKARDMYEKNRDEINAKQREYYAKRQAKKKAEKEAQITV